MKKLITNYTFDASAKQVVFTDYNPVSLAGILLITNVTDNIIIYNFADPALGGTVATTTLTLNYDTASMDDADKLQIWYDDGVGTVAVTQSGTWDEVGINDSGNSITVDNAALSVVGGGTEATAQRVTIASDSTGQVKLAAGTAEIGKLAAGTAEIGNVKNSGTFAVQATLAAETTKVIGTIRAASGGIASGALASGSIATGAIVDAKADDSAFTPATSRVFPMGAMADETATDSVDEGDVGVLRMTLDRKLVGASDSLEDAAETAGGYLSMMGSVRRDTPASSAGASGDNATLNTDAQGGLYVAHNITTIGHGVKTVTTAGTDVALATSTACKKVDIQAMNDNTGVIAVGGSGVDATLNSGTGVILYAGDIYCLEIDNLADVYIDATVSGNKVRFTYYS